MKKFILFCIFILSITFSYGQYNPIRFLGIPIDGSESFVIDRLEQRGFTYNPATGFSYGKFNGKESLVQVVNNKGKVCRIVVWQQCANEANAIVDFNSLYAQLVDNSKYTYQKGLSHGVMKVDEKIVSNILVYKKTYSNTFYYYATDNYFAERPDGILWYKIEYLSGDLIIGIFYDNPYNTSNGEDL